VVTGCALIEWIEKVQRSDTHPISERDQSWVRGLGQAKKLYS